MTSDRQGVRLRGRHHRPARARPPAAGRHLPDRARPGRGQGHRSGFSKQLAAALIDGTKIVITTLQKFPFVLRGLLHAAGAESAGEGDRLRRRRRPRRGRRRSRKRRYAVIVDEAHSSQTGETARELKAILGRGCRRNDDEERGGLGRPPEPGDGLARAAAEPELLRLHRHAQGQDAGAVRPHRSQRQAGALPPLQHAPGDRGGVHPRRAARTTPPTRPTTG